MLTDEMFISEVSENISILSKSATTLSVSLQISEVNFLPSEFNPSSNNCAAPRIPESGFLISCAKT